jgi:EAL domain-containing protein (putative c-di-GMP-specific phosphodiesterase class I)
MDDFGTGYPCLNLLHHLSIDTLKIDRAFVSRIGAEGTAGETVRAIISLARNLTMEVIGEGVESPDQLFALKQLERGYAQGYAFSEALDATRMGELIGAGRRW